MKIQYFKDYSPALGRDMEVKVYGHAGKPVLFIPCQDGRFVDFENFHMIDCWAKWIDAGECMVFSIDTIDLETWSDKNGDPGHRTWLHEQWIKYVTQEVVPEMQAMAMEANDLADAPKVLVFGASMGANHTLNLFLRFPDLFDCCLAMSGIYRSNMFFGSYVDENLYNNSPELYLQNMSPDHPYIEKYNKNKGIVCTGQGAWEEPDTLRWLDENFKRLGIDIWCDYWGYDVNHDWPWWYKQVDYFVPQLLGL